MKIPKGYEIIKPGEIIPKNNYYFNNLCQKNSENIANWSDGKSLAGQVRISTNDFHTFIKPIEKAEKPIENGQNQLEYKEITDIKNGDIFLIKGSLVGSLIVKNSDDKYSIAGFYGLEHWKNAQNLSKIQMLNYLNGTKQIYVTNINDKIAKSIEKARELVQNHLKNKQKNG